MQVCSRRSDLEVVTVAWLMLVSTGWTSAGWQPKVEFEGRHRSLADAGRYRVDQEKMAAEGGIWRLSLQPSRRRSVLIGPAQVDSRTSNLDFFTAAWPTPAS